MKASKRQPAKPVKTPRPPEMTREQYRAILHQLGLTYGSAASHLGISSRAAAGYGIGDWTVPPPTAKLLRLWLQLKHDSAQARAPF